MKIRVKFLEFVTGWMVIICVSFIILYDYLSTFIPKLPKFDVDYSTISSVLLISSCTLLAIYQNENRKKLEKIEVLPDTISGYQNENLQKLEKIESLSDDIRDMLKHSGNIKFFNNIDDVDKYIAKRISEARESVWDLNWQDYLSSNPSPRNEKKKNHVNGQIDNEIKKFCNHNKNIREYKEIFTFSYERNIDKMLDHIGYGPVYSCRYFDNKNPKTKFPKIQFVIIDEEEVIFVSSSYAPDFYSLKSKELVGVFRHYFQQAWDLATRIKSSDYIDKSEVDYIKSEYKK